jgi:hypothetical protein
MRPVLLGECIQLADLRKQPYRARLEGLNGVLFAIGLVRIAHLARSIEAGLPPSEPYTAAERGLYWRLVPEKVRRTQRAFDLLHEYYDFIEDRNGRAEALAALWLLHPVTPRLRRYLGMLHGAYIDDRHAEAAIICRAILERAISDACETLGVLQKGMINRITALESQKNVLTPAAASNARAVWVRGNEVIHKDPSFVSNSFEMIEYLLSVLDELSQYLAPPDDGTPSWLTG